MITKDDILTATMQKPKMIQCHPSKIDEMRDVLGGWFDDYEIVYEDHYLDGDKVGTTVIFRLQGGE